MNDKTCEGYVIFARATLDKSDTFAALTYEQKTLFFVLVLLANFKDTEWFDGGEKITIKRGQIITSVDSLIKILGRGATSRKVRTVLNKLSKLDFLTIKTTNKYSLITLINYEFYADPENYSTSKTTKDRQATDKRPTTNKKVKKDNKKDLKNIYVDFVDWFNSEFKTKHKPETFREKILARLDTYSVTQLKEAALAMKRDPYMMGENDRHRVFGTLEYITRNNINVDKFLNLKEPQNVESAKIAAKADKYRDVYAT